MLIGRNPNRTHYALFKFLQSWKRGLNKSAYVKSARIRSYSGPHFPAFSRIWTDDGEILRMRENARKMRTRITPNTDAFYEVLVLWDLCR